MLNKRVSNNFNIQSFTKNCIFVRQMKLNLTLLIILIVFATQTFAQTYEKDSLQDLINSFFNSEHKECLNSDMLTDFELRVSSMALVHESLYKKGNLASINVKEYFDNLIENLMGVYQLENNIEVENRILIEDLDIDTLVPLGLLSTEIVSNSMKYGVASLKNGKITVFLQALEDNWYELQIGDNGKGFDMEQKVNKNTLGIELIYTLVEQLDGELEFSNEKGANYKIKFKAQAKK